jgi:hypothetical protein
MRAKFSGSNFLSDKNADDQGYTTKNDFRHCKQMDALILLQGKIFIDYDWEAAEREELSAQQQQDKEL